MKPQDYIFLSKNLRKDGKFKEAETVLLDGIENHPNNIFLINNLILTYGKYKYDKAIEWFNYAINNDIEDIITCNIMLNIFGQKKKREVGEELFRYIKSEFKHEDLSVTYSTMLNLYVYLNDREASEKLFHEMETLEMNNYITHNSMLKLYVKLHDYEKSESFFSETVKKGLANSHTYSTIIQVYYLLNEYKKGLELIQKVPYHFKDSVILTHEIEFNRRLKLYDNCLLLIDKVLEFKNLRPENRTTIKINQAFCFKSLNQMDKAKEIFRELYNGMRENDPSYIRVLTGIIFCGDTKQSEVIKFTQELMKADREKKGRAHAVIEALKILSRMNEGYKVNNIERNIRKQEVKEINKNKN